jgi:electron transfer flavoprotein alpha/beta subunit
MMSQGRRSSDDDAAMLGFAVAAIGGFICFVVAVIMSLFGG